MFSANSSLNLIMSCVCRAGCTATPISGGSMLSGVTKTAGMTLWFAAPRRRDERHRAAAEQPSCIGLRDRMAHCELSAYQRLSRSVSSLSAAKLPVEQTEGSSLIAATRADR